MVLYYHCGMKFQKQSKEDLNEEGYFGDVDDLINDDCALLGVSVRTGSGLDSGLDNGLDSGDWFRYH